ncbi:glycosyltransferase [Corynebacterium timonense]|uniref:Glycosyltransferase involved in cell wall bisynthesis n=1 Tax=Corynebacterium timonense TaxID=441500 RepID=A0A1H1LLP6_9CORY|nr:glycosyltransferase [Corynebacterium timonense]SDR75446.1 Glycosyltransferase involved in cell wall bisynthesis [Corynebacterium timonense]
MTATLAADAFTARGAGMRIAFVAPARYPVREPYAGGLEAFCHTLVGALRAEGHHVDFYAAEGSDGNVHDFQLPGVDWGEDADAATDTTYPPGAKEREDAAFARLRAHLVEAGYDVVHNNSLNPFMFAGAHSPEPLPMVTTLHTPALPELTAAIRGAGDLAGRFAAVSPRTARSWTIPHPVHVIPNGVDVSAWRPGPGGASAVWFGRLVPEKGAHLAIDACRLVGIPLLLAGRMGDREYFRGEIEPRLDATQARWLGELSHAELRSLVGHCAVSVVTPRWEEPFGLVAFESMACGTPVAAFDRGGMGELLRFAPAALAEPDDVESLARAISAALGLSRGHVREWVARRYSLARTARRYTALYKEVALR